MQNDIMKVGNLAIYMGSCGCRAKSWTLMTIVGPFQPRVLCDSVIIHLSLKDIYYTIFYKHHYLS